MSDIPTSEILEAIGPDLQTAIDSAVDVKLAAANAKAPRLTKDAGVPDALKAFLSPELSAAPRSYTIEPPRQVMVQKANEFSMADLDGTGSGGMYSTDLHSQIIMSLLDASGVVEAGPTIVRTTHMRPIQYPVITADASFDIVAELDDSDPAYTTGDTVTLGGYVVRGHFVVSQELLWSAEYNLMQFLAEAANRALANKIAALLALGNGSTEPEGLFTHTATAVAATGAVTPEEMLLATKRVGLAYRRNAKLVVSDVLHSAMLGWRESDGDGQFLMRSLDGGGYQFAGKPVVIEPWADQSGLSASETHAIYGDISRGYAVRLGPIIMLRQDNPVAFTSTFGFGQFVDAKVIDASAMHGLKMAAGG